MKEVFEKMTENIRTKEELFFIIQKINLTQRLIFKNIEIPLSEKIKEKTEDSFSKKIQALEEKKIVSKDPEKNQVFFEKLKKYLKNIPEIKITIAFKPKKDFINKVYLWLEKEIKEKIILDLTINPEITGGAVVEYKGKKINLSLAKKIEENESF